MASFLDRQPHTLGADATTTTLPFLFLVLFGHFLCRLGLNESLYYSLYCFLNTSRLQTNKQHGMTEDGAQARWVSRHESPPPTTAHHLRPGILFAVRRTTSTLSWRDADGLLESRNWLEMKSQLYSYVHLPIHISWKGGSKALSRRAKRAWRKRLPIEGGTADYVYSNIFISKTLILSETWRNDCREFEKALCLLIWCSCVFCCAWWFCFCVISWLECFCYDQASTGSLIRARRLHHNGMNCVHKFASELTLRLEHIYIEYMYHQYFG